MENEGNAGTASSSRWSPTKEQITLLENLYKQGIRTPSADQIQQITGRLRAFGHIEGKNVFYWFQNHKARQRQKQKQDRIASFNRLLHKTSRFFHPIPCSNVGCVSPYYLHQVSDGLSQHGSVYRQDDFHSNKVMLPSGGYEKRTITDHGSKVMLPSGDDYEKRAITDRKKHVSDITTTTARLSMSSSSLRFDRFAPRDHGFYGEGINVSSNGQETLPLFPLQPLHATNDDAVGTSNFATCHDSPATNVGDGAGRGQPFIDFFSGGSCRFDNSGNGL